MTVEKIIENIDSLFGNLANNNQTALRQMRRISQHAAAYANLEPEACEEDNPEWDDEYEDGSNDFDDDWADLEDDIDDEDDWSEVEDDDPAS